MRIVKIAPVASTEAKKPTKKNDTFFAGLPFRFLMPVLALCAKIKSGESDDVVADVKEIERLVSEPAYYVGVGTTIREHGTGEMIPFILNGKPVLRADSLILYTEDPTRERSSDEKAGALVRTFGQQPGFIKSHPVFQALESLYQEEIGVSAPAGQGQTAIPAGTRSVPAGEEEVAAR